MSDSCRSGGLAGMAPIGSSRARASNDSPRGSPRRGRRPPQSRPGCPSEPFIGGSRNEGRWRRRSFAGSGGNELSASSAMRPGSTRSPRRSASPVRAPSPASAGRSSAGPPASCGRNWSGRAGFRGYDARNVARNVNRRDRRGARIIRGRSMVRGTTRRSRRQWGNRKRLPIAPLAHQEARRGRETEGGSG